MADPKSFLLTAELGDYLVAHGTPPDAVQQALIAETAKLGAGRGHADRARAGRVPHDAHARARRAFRDRDRHVHRLLRAVHRARAARPTVTCSCCDVSEEWTAIGRAHWDEAGVADRIELRIAPAVDTLAALPADDDSSTSRSSTPTSRTTRTTSRSCCRGCAPNGVILVDNVLWGGNVVKADADDENTRRDPARSTTRSPPTTASTP